MLRIALMMLPIAMVAITAFDVAYNGFRAAIGLIGLCVISVAVFLSFLLRSRESLNRRRDV